MTPQEPLTRLGNAGVVAVVRSDDAESAMAVARGAIEGGIEAVEITMSVPEAPEVLRELVRDVDTEILLGAGTVTNAAEADLAVEVGAEFVVSPYLAEEVVEVAGLRGVLAIPGILTPREVALAGRLGVAAVKLYPAATVGAGHLRALRAVFPHLRAIPTGGINPDNVHEWTKAGALAIGVGEFLTRAWVYGGSEGVRDAAREVFEEHVAARRPA